MNEAARKVQQAILREMPRSRSGKRRMVAMSLAVSELALETGLHPHTIRTAVRRYGASMFRTARLEYSGAIRTYSGRGEFGRQPGNPAGRMPATVDVTPND